MRMARLGPRKWAAAPFAAVLTVGLAGVAPVQTSVTSTHVSASNQDADSCVLPGVTIAANDLQRTLGGA